MGSMARTNKIMPAYTRNTRNKYIIILYMNHLHGIAFRDSPEYR